MTSATPKLHLGYVQKVEEVTKLSDFGSTDTTLDLLGLGILDETETESIPHARRVEPPTHPRGFGNWQHEIETYVQRFHALPQEVMPVEDQIVGYENVSVPLCHAPSGKPTSCAIKQRIAAAPFAR